MSLPANIRVNTQAPFPSRILGLGALVLTKNNGIWTFSLDYTKLAVAPSITPYQEVMVYDEALKTYALVNLIEAASAGMNAYREVSGGGTIDVLPTDIVLLVNGNPGNAATSIILPASSTRNGAPVTVKDLVGDANTNNITFVPNGTETIDGFSAAASASNGVALIDINYGKKTLFPLLSGGWYL